jgi:hypothetical protein
MQTLVPAAQSAGKSTVRCNRTIRFPYNSKALRGALRYSHADERQGWGQKR